MTMCIEARAVRLSVNVNVATSEHSSLSRCLVSVERRHTRTQSSEKHRDTVKVATSQQRNESQCLSVPSEHVQHMLGSERRRERHRHTQNLSCDCFAVRNASRCL